MSRTFLVGAAVLTAGLLASTTAPIHGQTTTPAAQAEKAAAARLEAGDEAYKKNCTRCHSELGKVNGRATKTIVMHMRARANMRGDDARLILEYLNQ